MSAHDTLNARGANDASCDRAELLRELVALKLLLSDETPTSAAGVTASKATATAAPRCVRIVGAFLMLLLALVVPRAEAMPVRCSVDLLQLAEAWVDAGREETRYAVPAEETLARFDAAFAAFDDAPPVAGDGRLGALGLASCRGNVLPTGGGTVDVIYDPRGYDAAVASGLPVLALRRGVEGPAVILSVPHAVTEWRVARQAVEALALQPGVRAVLIGAVHRCRLDEAAPDAFQGVTSECGGTFRASDQAHTQASHFHVAHRVLWERHPLDVTVQLHGMSADGISVSAGTVAELREFPNRAALRLHETFAAELEAQDFATDTLTSCSAHNGPRGDRRRELLCGTVNAQLAGATALGRAPQFVHVEQSRAVRDTDAPRQALAPALLALTDWIFAHGMEH